MPEAGTQRSLVAAGSVGPDWRGMGPADPENWTTRVQRVPPEERRVVDGGCRADDEYGGSLGGCVAGNSSEPMAHGRVERSQARFLGARKWAAPCTPLVGAPSSRRKRRYCISTCVAN
jgi:hypothetical protein